MNVLPWPGENCASQPWFRKVRNACRRVSALEGIRELDLRLQGPDAARSLSEGQVSIILRGLIGLFAQPLQPLPLRPGHLLREENPGVVFTLNLHVRSPSSKRDLTICSYFVLTSHGQQN